MQFRQRQSAIAGIIIIYAVISEMPKKINRGRHNESDEDDEYDDEHSKAKKKQQAHPRFIKNTIDDVNLQEIVVNLSKTHYDIIEIVVEELGWVVQHSKKSQKWDIMWTDYHIEAQDLFKLNDHQKISHFPAIYVLAKKNFLGRSLMKMSKFLPNDFNYFPPTWSVPSQIGELIRNDNQTEEDNKPIYIFKPQASSQGKGIVLISKLEDLQGKTGIVQIYVNNPFLIENLKFDMRIYVLIYGCDPMRIYIYEEGLARFATQKYQKAKKKNMKDNFIHLTNYAINKTNKKFVFNTSETNMNVGHKRSLTSIFNYLKNRGVDVDEIKRKIDRLIVKTLLVGKPMLEHMYGLSQTDNLANDHCFHILGMDVMLNQHLQPILLEVNHTPSFVTDTPLDKTIKKNLIRQTLLLLNVTTQTKKAKIEKKKDFQQKRSQRKTTKLTPQEKIEQKKLIEREKDLHQATILKKYRRLFPIQSNQYSQIEQYAKRIFNEQYGFKNKEKQKEANFQMKITAQIRPVSLESMPTAKKFNETRRNVARVTSSNMACSGNNLPLEQLLEKLPDISPKRPSSILKSTASSPKKVVKNYEFSPQKIFSQFQDKIALHKLKYRQNLADQGSIFVERDKLQENKKEGAFVQPKLLKLTQIVPKNLQLFDDIAVEYSIKLQNIDKSKRKNFIDFMSLSNKQKNLIPNDKNSIVTVKKQQKSKSNRLHNNSQRKINKIPINSIEINKYDDLVNEQVFMMKSLTISKGRPSNI